MSENFNDKVIWITGASSGIGEALASSGTSRLYGGTGLGLAIVKQLVEPQGGRIGKGAEYLQ